MKTQNQNLLSKLHQAYTAVDGWCWKHKIALIALGILGAFIAIAMTMIDHNLTTK